MQVKVDECKEQGMSLGIYHGSGTAVYYIICRYSMYVNSHRICGCGSPVVFPSQHQVVSMLLVHLP